MLHEDSADVVAGHLGFDGSPGKRIFDFDYGLVRCGQLSVQLHDPFCNLIVHPLRFCTEVIHMVPEEHIMSNPAIDSLKSGIIAGSSGYP
jgi:hypothetical protein